MSTNTAVGAGTKKVAEQARIRESGRQTAIVDRKRGMSLETMRSVRAERDRQGGDRPEWVDGYTAELAEMERTAAALGCQCFAPARVAAYPVDRCSRCGLPCEVA